MQLRAWQALTVFLNQFTLDNLIDFLPRILAHFTLPHLPDVRGYQEYALCCVLQKMKKWKDLTVDSSTENKCSEEFVRETNVKLTKVANMFSHHFETILLDLDGSPMTGASALVTVGYWLQHGRSAQYSILDTDRWLNVIITPFLTSNVAVVRATAQLVFFQRMRGDFEGRKRHVVQKPDKRYVIDVCFRSGQR